MIEVIVNSEIVANGADLLISPEVFKNNSNITDVDLKKYKWVNNSAALAFSGCSNLYNVSNISNFVDDIGGMFEGCSNISTMQIIPNSVSNKTYSEIPLKYRCYDTDQTYDVRTRDYSYITTNNFYLDNYNTIFVYEYDQFYNLYSQSIYELNDEYIEFRTRTGAGNETINATRNIENDINDTNNSTYIGLYQNCSGLVDVEINYSNVTDLRYGFSKCNNLNNAVINCNSLQNGNNLFNGCNKLKEVTIIGSDINNINNAFNGCTNIQNITLNVGSITSIEQLFSNCSNLANVNIISNSIINMYYAFYRCTNIQNIYFNTPSVTDMDRTFYECSKLVNAPVIPNSVTNMSWTFFGCSNLVNAPVIPNSVTNMSYAFNGCSNLINAPVIPDNVTDMTYTFNGCTSLRNVYIESENIVNLSGCFYSTSSVKKVRLPFRYQNGVNTLTYNSFIQYYNSEQNGVCLLDINSPIDFKDWRYDEIDEIKYLLKYYGDDVDITVPNYKTVLNSDSGVFSRVYSLNSVDLNNVNFVNNSMSGMFYHKDYLRSVTNINENVTDMHSTFEECRGISSVVLPNNVINLYGTFNRCTGLVNAPVIPNSVTDMSHTFSYCTRLVNAPVIPNSVTDMCETFSQCSNLVNATDIPDSVLNMYGTFSNCTNLIHAPNIGNNVTVMYYTFYNCYNLVNIPDLPDSVEFLSGTFDNCTNLVGNIYINSQIISDAGSCFANTSLEKNVFIPFNYTNIENMYAWNAQNPGYEYDYPEILYTKSESPLSDTAGQVFYANGNPFIISNISSTSANTYIDFGGWALNYTRNVENDILEGSYTLTYNSFINAGYSASSRKDGVRLFDPNSAYINFNITPDVTTVKYLNGNEVVNNRDMALDNNTYILYNENYPIYIGHVSNLAPRSEYNVIVDLTSISGYTITVNTGVTGLNVSFNVDNTIINANDNNDGTYSINAYTDEEITIECIIDGDTEYMDAKETITFNNQNITEDITLTPATWESWSRPNLSSNGTEGGSSFACKDSNNGSTAYRAYDGITSTSNFISGGKNYWTEFYNPDGVCVNYLNIRFYSTYYIPTTNPILQGSNDGVHWETITTSVGSTAYSAYRVNATGNTKGYKYHRLYLENTRTGYSIWLIEVTINGTIKVPVE